MPNSFMTVQSCCICPNPTENDGASDAIKMGPDYPSSSDWCGEARRNRIDNVGKAAKRDRGDVEKQVPSSGW